MLIFSSSASRRAVGSVPFGPLSSSSVQHLVAKHVWLLKEAPRLLGWHPDLRHLSSRSYPTRVRIAPYLTFTCSFLPIDRCRGLRSLLFTQNWSRQSCRNVVHVDVAGAVTVVFYEDSLSMTLLALLSLSFRADLSCLYLDWYIFALRAVCRSVPLFPNAIFPC